MDKSILEVVYQSFKELHDAGLLEESKTDWKRLSEMIDEQINMDDIAELDDAFFRDAELKRPPK